MKVSLELSYDVQELTRQEFRAKRKALLRKSGVYILMDSRGTVLYVGMSRNLSARLRSHISGYSNVDTSRLDKIRILLTQSTTVADMLETYMIRELRPLYNINKTEHIDVEEVDYGQEMYLVEWRIKETQSRIDELKEELNQNLDSYEEDGDSATDSEVLGAELFLIRELRREESRLDRLLREESLLKRQGAINTEQKEKTSAGLRRIATRRARYGDARGWFIRDNAILGGNS